MCGYPFEADDLRWEVTFPDEADLIAEQAPGPRSDVATYNETPVHRICGLYAAQVCPFVSSPYARLSDDQRRGQRRGAVLALRGYRTTSDVLAIPSELQPGVNILFFEMGDLVETIVLRDAAEARSVYDAALDADGPMDLDDATRDLVAQVSGPADGGDAGKVLAGGAVAVGAAFLEGVDRVQGLASFGEPDSPYRVMAARLAHEPGSVGWEDFSDPHMRVALRWVATRHHLPVVLAGWHRRARRTTRVERGGGGAPSAPRPPQSKNKQGASRAKAQRAARRKNRR